MDLPSIPFNNIKFFDKRGLYKTVIVFRDYKAILLNVMNEVLKDRSNEQDRVYVVGGVEGSGKSNFCLLLVDLHDELTGQLTDISQITRNISEFEEQLSIRKTPSCLVIDEGSELSSDRYTEKQSKTIKEKFTVMRKRSHFIPVCFNNPARIHTYFREDRFRGVFVCKRRGVVYYYSNSNFRDVLEHMNKGSGDKSTKTLLRYAPNYIIYNVPRYDGRLRKPYEDRKDGNIDLKLSNNFTEKKDYVSLKKVYTNLHMHPYTMDKYIEQGIITEIRLGSRRYLDTDNINKLETYLKSKQEAKR